MVLSFCRTLVVILALSVLLTALIQPVNGTGTEVLEITVREDVQLLRQTIQNVAAGIGAAVCAGVIFRIVWKQKEP